MRYMSVPERLGAFGVGVAGAALVYPRLAGLTGFGLPCPLRTVTGIPCPVCGMTTAAVALVAGHPAAALAANPCVLVLAILAVIAPALVALRAADVASTPAPWSPAARRRVGGAVGLLALASWSYQLHRFGYL